MAQVLSFENHALARLRERLGEAEEARADLIAFARGHSGAVNAIHDAVLAAMAARGIDETLRTVTDDWPAILGIDSIALAMIVGDDGFCAGRDRVQRMAPRLIERAMAAEEVVMRSVERGHPLFGKAGPAIRAEALISMICGPGLPRGILLLGQHDPHPLDTRHGAHLLQFLGRSLSAMVARWLTETNN